MKISAVNAARSIWLFPTLFLNPYGRYIFPAAQGLAERYKFAVLPDREALAKQPLNLKFEGGSFIAPSGLSIFVGLNLHPDGMVADTRSSTDDADAFLADALSWFSSTYDLPQFSDLSVRRIYLSEVVVQIDKPLTVFNAKFNGFANRLKNGFKSDPGKALELKRLHFGPDPSTYKAAGSFIFERLADTPFADNQYFSSAPLPTAEHLELLKELEDAATDAA